MTAIVKWGAIGLGAAAALCALASAAVYLSSEALIVRRYTLPSSIVQASALPADRVWGEHLARIFGCRDCHAADLRGRAMWTPPDLSIAAPDLRGFAARYTDADFDRAVRRGLTPDARAIWVMPSGSYVYMRNPDLADIIGYIRALPPGGHPPPPPEFGFRTRLAILAGSIAPVDPYRLGQNPPLNVGPRYDGGRYLAAMACSGCHGTDLGGTDTAPDLKATADYSRTQFFALLYRGEAVPGHTAPAMARAAGARFRAFKDYEVDALYAYLRERAKTLDLNAAH